MQRKFLNLWYFTQVGEEEDKGREGRERERVVIYIYLNIEQPGLDLLGSLHPVSDVPDDKIERPSREEALVRGVVLLLAPKIPCHERDAL